MKKCESKLNPLAEEFVPSPRRRLSATAPEFFPWGHFRRPIASEVAQAQLSRAQPGSSHAGSESSSRIRKGKNAEKESKIKRTVYVSDIDPRITEEELMREFSNCGVVKGSCICGDTQSGLHYGFVEFENEDCAKAAMRLNCTRIGLYPVRVLPSHRTIAPRNRLPSHSGDDQEKIVRTVYCSYIDKMLSEKDLKEFFEIQCGEEEFAVTAIKCTGMVLGNYRVKYTTLLFPLFSYALLIS
ncbi:polyadenylate-binding protein-interacting protein 8-like protein [Carex littledalei]|uniref:Polyadenylate-binding protein-interacting protein 8-like protein n=1 Tax=Carex littledalei TaxID=544730 RepID=A0A833VKC2_9POAL|nr:polyadenylate-binding protein-interacting protein 8-like protein [Carex littledalei]